MKLSYVLIGLVIVALLVAAFAAGFFIGSTHSVLGVTFGYGPGAMMRSFGNGYGTVPGYRPGFGMPYGFNRGLGRVGGFFPGLGLFGLGFRFLVPLAFLALIVLVVILLVRRPQPAAVVAPAATNPPTETKV